MIISWNVRGMNNAGKSREVIAQINKINHVLAILVETRVKHYKARVIRNKIGSNWSFLDNYEKHHNGRIWIIWDALKIKVTKSVGPGQLIHCELENLNDGVKE